jgi:hypothetical protein
MFPLRDMVWGMFLRGVLYGFLAGIVVIVIFLRGAKYGSLAGARPIGFVYFLAGLEVGIASIGAITLYGLHAWNGFAHRMGQRMLDQSKH